MNKTVSIPLALVLCLVLAASASAAGESVTFVSDTDVIFYGPQRSYAPLGDSAMGEPKSAVETFVHPEWPHSYNSPPYLPSAQPERYRPEFDGAFLIGSAYLAESLYTAHTWRWFTKSVELCPGAANIAGTIWIDAHNAAEVYVNGVSATYTEYPGIVEYPFAVSPGADVLSLDFIVQNYPGSSNPRQNPTGLIFQAVVAFDCVVQVQVDIKPGSDANSVNCNDETEVLAVAILTTEDFDATTVDHTAVTFAGASETHVDKKGGEPRRHEEDVDGDGDIDLVFQFRLGDTGLTCDFVEGTLTGETYDGFVIEGTDAIRMVDRGGGKS